MSGEIRAFTMPKWGIEMSEGVVAEWRIKPGADVRKGDIICLIESDKISNDVEAERDDHLGRVLAEPGVVYPVGALLAIFADTDVSDAQIDAFVGAFSAPDTSFGDTSPTSNPPVPVEAVAEPKQMPQKTAIEIPADIAISPRARILVQDLSVDLQAIVPTGRRGRITAQDVRLASKPKNDSIARPAIAVQPADGAIESGPLASPKAKRLARDRGISLADISGTGRRGRIRATDLAPARGQSERIPFSRMRATIARRVTEAKRTIPHYYVRTEIDVDLLINYRGQINRQLGLSLSVNDFIIRGCALALIENPNLNIHVHEDGIERFQDADISVAVATDAGLYVPVIRAAQSKSLPDISREMADLAQRARENQLSPEDYRGGSFSISNLGMFGVTVFDAIINQPQGAILAVGAARRMPIAHNYALLFSQVMTVSLSLDHRAIDGAMGGKFLQSLKRLLEAPAQLMERP
jgi:pyruvate dehydrogenase E2 component (dihydrolipoamide acetyltransferase)